jgi:hypothetical protein
MIALALAALPGPWFGFGNGFGLSAPYFGGTYFWLRDMKTKRCAWYTWLGGFGAQLHSYELRAPKAGTERLIKGRLYVPFREPQRRFLTVEIAWCLKEFQGVRGGPPLELLREIRNDLDRLVLD